METADFTLDIRLVAAGPAVISVDTEDCTSDTCGDTADQATMAALAVNVAFHHPRTP
ncbi:hypothetical protein [Streptosporangium subroseum]|uniref:hypothetical protein n=1 Tax=Streptosporangium subroseum TaxID=106412 RepID=UPI00308F4990|nr:hypothetical protein OHB15_05880 [Streptosporangium subroseum]